MHMRGRRHRRRRAFALSVAVLWLLAVELLPNLHLAFHHDDHTHRDGAIVATRRPLVVVSNGHTHAGDHDHDGAAADHQHGDRVAELEARLLAHEQQAPRRRRTPQLAFDEAPSGHTAGGIAHRDLALQQPPPPLLVPVSAPHADLWVHAVPVDRPFSVDTRRPTARGPPA